MIVGAVADIHGNFEALARAMERHPDVRDWICVGDLASRTGAYPEPDKLDFDSDDAAIEKMTRANERSRAGCRGRRSARR